MTWTRDLRAWMRAKSRTCAALPASSVGTEIENLELVTSAEHGLRHTVLSTSKKCVQCGKEFTPHKTKRRRAKTCSPQCKSALQSARYTGPSLCRYCGAVMTHPDDWPTGHHTMCGEKHNLDNRNGAV